MSRGRTVALVALGCALAAAAAGTGPYLSAGRKKDTTFAELLRTAARERRVRVLEDQGTSRARLPFETVLNAVLLAIAAATAVYVVWRLALLVVRLVGLRLPASRGGAVSTPYDPGDESAEDAETALRKRLAEDLTMLSAGIEDVPDPREAVIACYARMERALAEAGSARRADEAPLELLARVLAEQYVPEGDVRRLTELFEEARFSSHPVTDEMRAAARRSLANVADALAVPA